MEKDLIILDLVKILSQEMPCPKRTPSETIASLKSLPSTWCLWLRSEESPEVLNSMDDSMQLTRLPLTSACPCLSGLTSEAQSLASESTRRLISSRRYLSSTELRLPRYMIPKLWTGLHTSHWPAMSLTGATLTLPGSSPLNNPRPSSLSGRKASLTMRSSVEKTSLMERIMSSETRLSVLQERGTRTTIRQSSAGLSTMLRNFSGRSHTIQTTSILKPMTSLFCTDTDGRWSCSLNGLSSISRLNLFGALLRMLSESRYMSLSLHTVSLLLWNMISNWADRWLKSCVSWVVHCLSRIPSRSSSNLWLESRLMATSSSSVLNLHTINIY